MYLILHIRYIDNKLTKHEKIVQRIERVYFHNFLIDMFFSESFSIIYNR